MVELCFGHGDNASVGDLLSGLEDSYAEDGEAEVSEAVENELVKLLNKSIIDAYRQGVSDIHIEPLRPAARRATRVTRARRPARADAWQRQHQ